MATLARDSSSDSDSDVSYDSFDRYPTEAANAQMTVVPYDSGDEQRHAPMDTSSDDGAETEIDDDAVTEIDDDAETEIDDVEMAVVSLKY